MRNFSDLMRSEHEEEILLETLLQLHLFPLSYSSSRFLEIEGQYTSVHNIETTCCINQKPYNSWPLLIEMSVSLIYFISISQETCFLSVTNIHVGAS